MKLRPLVCVDIISPVFEVVKYEITIEFKVDS